MHWSGAHSAAPPAPPGVMPGWTRAARLTSRVFVLLTGSDRPAPGRVTACAYAPGRERRRTGGAALEAHAWARETRCRGARHFHSIFMDLGQRRWSAVFWRSWVRCLRARRVCIERYDDSSIQVGGPPEGPSSGSTVGMPRSLPRPSWSSFPRARSNSRPRTCAATGIRLGSLVAPSTAGGLRPFLGIRRPRRRPHGAAALRRARQLPPTS